MKMFLILEVLPKKMKKLRNEAQIAYYPGLPLNKARVFFLFSAFDVCGVRSSRLGRGHASYYICYVVF